MTLDGGFLFGLPSTVNAAYVKT